jgi:orotate phosphoribosyltransferase
MGDFEPMSHYQEQDRLDLKTMLCAKSVCFGKVTLASGQQSDVYVDAKLTTCSPEAMPLVGRVFLHKMQSRGWLPQAVGGLTVGADPIAIAIARESLETEHRVNAFIVRKEAKRHGRQKLVEGLEPTVDRQVVIIDDVCSEGSSSALAIRNSQSVGMRILGAICLVDREMGAAELLRNEFGIELESIFKLSELRPVSDECFVGAGADQVR